MQLTQVYNPRSRPVRLVRATDGSSAARFNHKRPISGARTLPLSTFMKGSFLSSRRQEGEQSSTDSRFSLRSSHRGRSIHDFNLKPQSLSERVTDGYVRHTSESANPGKRSGEWPPQVPASRKSEWRRSIQELIANAVHAALADGSHLGPAAVADNLFERHPIAGSTPGSHQYVGIQFNEFSRRCVAKPGAPANFPPAASTNSATQGCEAMSGLPIPRRTPVSRQASPSGCAYRSVSSCMAATTCSPRFATPIYTAMVATSV